ncbi:MAG: hypothetical protein QOH27_582 [Mycobacterium sp.]|nr:hypothetical protein [Mycobacterium sp.]
MHTAAGQSRILTGFPLAMHSNRRALLDAGTLLALGLVNQLRRERTAKHGGQTGLGSETMAGTFLAQARRALAATVALLAVGTPRLAQASPTFDEQGYSTCTATTIPGPDQNMDTIATTCCVDHGGTPTGTTYGMGCAAQVDNPPEDYRPTIYMPTRPSPPEEGDDPALDELEKQPPLPPPP